MANSSPVPGLPSETSQPLATSAQSGRVEGAPGSQSAVLEPAVVGMPRVTKMSLCAIGMPSSAPDSPAARRVSACAAVAGRAGGVHMQKGTELMGGCNTCKQVLTSLRAGDRLVRPGRGRVPLPASHYAGILAGSRFSAKGKGRPRGRCAQLIGVHVDCLSLTASSRRRKTASRTAESGVNRGSTPLWCPRRSICSTILKKSLSCGSRAWRWRPGVQGAPGRRCGSASVRRSEPAEMEAQKCAVPQQSA